MNNAQNLGRLVDHGGAGLVEARKKRRIGGDEALLILEQTGLLKLQAGDGLSALAQAPLHDLARA